MGVFPGKLSKEQKNMGLPHARGGVSHQVVVGCVVAIVFPTLVGVFLSADGKGSIAHRLPHARGVFHSFIIRKISHKCLPHARGVFPTW